MTRKTLPPRFKNTKLAPMAAAAKKIVKVGHYRGSSNERGYDEKWRRLSIAFRKRNPYCAWCAQEQRDALSDLVDHMIPVVDRPELLHSWDNLWSLCRHHHGRKFSMEIYARDNGLLDMLPTWCKSPSSRPRAF